MKKKMLLSALLLSGLCFGLVGCGEKEDDSAVNVVSNVGSEATAPYDKEIKTSMVISDAYGKVKTPYTDTAWGKAYKDDLNIVLDVKAAIPSANYDERLNTLIASNDLPDFFRVSPAMLEQLIEDDMLQDITKVYDKYASDRLKQYTEGKDKAALEGSKVDGKIYGIPMADTGAWSGQIIYIRKDWLDKLNLEVPKTIDDVWNVAKAFKDNKMGGENTIGIPMDKNLNSLKGIVTAYGAHIDAYEYNKETKKIEFSSTQQSMKNALKEVNEKFEEGLIDPEFVAKDTDKMYEDIKAGRVGIWFDGTGSDSMAVQPLFESDANANFICTPIYQKDGSLATQVTGTGAGAFWVVKKGAKNPEAVFKLLNYTLYRWDNFKTNDEYKTYNYNEPTGQEGFNGFQIGGEPIYDMDWPAHRKYYEENGTFAEHTQNQAKIQFERMADFEKNGESKDYTSANFKFDDFQSSETGRTSALGEYYDNKSYVYSYDQGFGSPTMTLKKGILDKIELDALLGIVTGSKSIDEFDKFVKDWDDNGGSKIEDELTDWIGTKDIAETK